MTITGPGSPSVLGNVVVSIEQHVDWIADLLAFCETNGIGRVEAQHDAETTWTSALSDLAAQTVYPSANSWYLGANVPGKPRVFMPYIGGFNRYRRICDRIAREGYAGFTLSETSHSAERSAFTDVADARVDADATL